MKIASRLLSPFLLLIASLAQAQVVTNTSDNGSGSLRDAIATAASGSTITFNIPTSDAGYNASTGLYIVALSTVGDGTFGPSALVVNKALTIDGGASKITITRDATAQPARLRFFYVSPAGNSTLRNVTMSNGLPAGGNGGNAGRREGGGREAG